ncbi:MAG TPA: acyltransferase [Bacteroidales bacterium]|nr:acyltransferase [Bacteroidales bacterium]
MKIMISKWILKLMGWKIVGEYYKVDKCIIVVAPHTSMMDFVVGRLFFNTLPIKVHFVIKKEMFFFPLGYLLKALGAIPVDRGTRNNMVDQLADLFNSKDKMFLIITPEGTRKKVLRWKRGFYFIAEKANVPIYTGILDYKKKEIFVGEQFIPTGDIEVDMKAIRLRYKGATGKHPEYFSIGNAEE